MIYFPLSKLVDTAETVVAPGAAVLAEGSALVRSGVAGVTPAVAVDASEVFAGFSIAGVSAAPFVEAYATKVEEFVVPAGGTVTLAQTPVGGQITVYDITLGAVDATITVVGKVIGTLTVASTVRITYKYALTVTQSRALQGDAQPGGYSGLAVGQIGLVKRGLIYTDQFDAGVNWLAATAIKLAPGGLVTSQAGVGAALVGAYVVSVPSQEVPFLGLEFSAV
jgi:hypothetical protein